MQPDFDLILRGGTVVDGSGGEPFQADVGVKGQVVAAVGKIAGRGVEEIDAKDRIVTPGFVDIHTHYDGQADWSDRFGPSSDHGVTTVLTGNCGVGFAPCEAHDRDKLVRLMEGVEDIPEIVLTAGLSWNWRTFSEFLDVLGAKHYDMDVACLFPHAPLRLFVMGDRAMNREPASEADVAAMRAFAREAMEAGAIGFSTSRSLNHRASDGSLTPSYAAGRNELIGIAMGLRDARCGTLQLISDFDDVDSEFDLMREMARQSGRPLSFTLLHYAKAPARWRVLLDKVEAANADGIEVRAQVFGRPVGLLVGLELSLNPFTLYPSYQQIAKLPFENRLRALRDPDMRARILSETPTRSEQSPTRYLADYDNMFPLGDDPIYEPKADQSIEARAARAGQRPEELVYDLLVAHDGRDLLYIPAVNFVEGDAGPIEAMLRHPHTLYGLGDGGAHLGLICDASMPTYMLTRWARGLGGSVPLTEVVHRLTAANAAAMGLRDRGLVRIGGKADLNVIDYAQLRLERPKVLYDLPSAGRRICQSAVGYDATIVSGAITYRDGQATGALPGRLVRGRQRLDA